MDFRILKKLTSVNTYKIDFEDEEDIEFLKKYKSIKGYSIAWPFDPQLKPVKTLFA